MTLEEQIKYFGAAVRNMKINEFNRDCYEHDRAVPYGLTPNESFDIDWGSEDAVCESLSRESADNWLAFIDNLQLYKAMSTLKTDDRQFLFEMFVNDRSQEEMAELYAIDQSNISRRLKRIVKHLKLFF